MVLFFAMWHSYSGPIFIMHWVTDSSNFHTKEISSLTVCVGLRLPYAEPWKLSKISRHENFQRPILSWYHAQKFLILGRPGMRNEQKTEIVIFSLYVLKHYITLKNFAAVRIERILESRPLLGHTLIICNKIGTQMTFRLKLQKLNFCFWGKSTQNEILL